MSGAAPCMRPRLAEPLGHRHGLGLGCSLLEDELGPIPGVDANQVARAEVPLEQPQRKRILEQPLDCALQRTRTIRRVPPRLGDDLLGCVSQLELEPALGEALAQPHELELDDLAELFAAERAELDDLV